MPLMMPQQEAASSSRNYQPQPHEFGGRSSQQNVRLIIVDDHAMVREGLRGLLELRSHLLVIGEAGNGEDALRIVSEKRPDLVIMDINMPGMNGIEATRKLREMYPHLKIIGLSYHDDQQRIQMMKGAGADAYISKGGSSEELFHVINRVMGNTQ